MTYKTLPAPASTNQQVREYTTAVEKGYNSLFVVATSKGWNLTRASDQKLIAQFNSKSTAITEAKKQAASTKGNLFVFDIAGELLETI